MKLFGFNAPTPRLEDSGDGLRLLGVDRTFRLGPALVGMVEQGIRIIPTYVFIDRHAAGTNPTFNAPSFNEAAATTIRLLHGRRMRWMAAPKGVPDHRMGRAGGRLAINRLARS